VWSWRPSGTGSDGSADPGEIGGHRRDVSPGQRASSTIDLSPSALLTTLASPERTSGGQLYTSSTVPVLVDLQSGEVSFPGRNWRRETLLLVENAVTGAGNDTLIGDDGSNFLSGGAGDRDRRRPGFPRSAARRRERHPGAFEDPSTGGSVPIGLAHDAGLRNDIRLPRSTRPGLLRPAPA
jgi:hypothetical protein